MKENKTTTILRFLIKLKNLYNNYFFLATGTTFAIVYGICPSISAILTGKIVTYLVVVNQTLAEYDEIVVYQNYLLLLGVWMPIFAFFQSYCYAYASIRIAEKIKRKYFERNLTIADSKIKILQTSLYENFGILLRNCIHLISGLFVAFYYNWHLALACSTVIPALLVFSEIISIPLKSAVAKERTHLNDAKNRANEILSGIRTVQMCNAEKFEQKKYASTLKLASKYTGRKDGYNGILSGFVQFMVFTYMGLGALYGTWLYQNGILREIGYVYTVMASIAAGAFPLIGIKTQIKNLKIGIKTYRDVFQITEKKQVIENMNFEVPYPKICHEKTIDKKEDTGEKLAKKSIKNAGTPDGIAYNHWKMYFLAFICIFLHSLGPPIYAFLNGAYFAIFEAIKVDYMTPMWSLLKFYIIMAVITAIALAVYTKLLGKIGGKICLTIRYFLYSTFLNQERIFYDNPANAKESILTLLNTDAEDTIAAYDLRLGQFTNAILCTLLSYGFAYQKNSYMGALASLCFFIQSLAQFFIGVIHQHAKKNKNFMTGLKFASANGLQQFTQAIAYIIGYWLTKQGHIDEPLVIHKIIQTLLQSSMMIPNAPAYLQDVKKSKISYKKIRPYLEMNSAKELCHIGTKNMKGAIQFKHVNFANPYKPNHNVLENLSFQIDVGQFVSIVALTKHEINAIFSLLNAFDSPSSGKILIDGNDIRKLNRNNLRNQICFIECKPVLFSGTIKENIAYGLEKIDLCDILSIAKRINLDHFVVQLPQGYETEIGQNGCRLPLHIRQRIASARALIRQPKILLLDDFSNEKNCTYDQALLKSIEKIRYGKTCIMASQTLPATFNFNQIIELNKNFNINDNEIEKNKDPTVEDYASKEEPSTSNYLWDPPALPIGCYNFL